MNRQPWALTNNLLTLYCHIQPGAKQNQLIGLYDHCLKIQLKTPPVEGKANRALIDYLANLCGVRKSQVSIKRGLTSRKKTIVITDIYEIPANISEIAKE